MNYMANFCPKMILTKNFGFQTVRKVADMKYKHTSYNSICWFAVECKYHGVLSVNDWDYIFPAFCKLGPSLNCHLDDASRGTSPSREAI